MDTLSFQLPTGSCTVHFYSHLYVPPVPETGGIYVADSNTISLLKKAENFRSDIPLVVLEAGEAYKNFESVQLILKTAFDAKLARDSLFIGFGGGVVTDITAFAASLYMRGAQLNLVPTTLLSMADAAIGGKTGVDFENYKNSIGTFYPAKDIYISIEALSTLSEKEYKSGLAEVLKTALLFSPKLYSILEEKKDAIRARDTTLLLEIVKRCAHAKAQVIERDLYESGERMFLNLGHTFAHALESVSGFGTLTHGEAVAWGMVRALELGKKLNITSNEYVQDVKNTVKEYGWEIEPIHSFFLDKIGQGLTAIEIADELLTTMKSDKKKRKKEVQFVLQREMNSNLTMAVSDTDILAILQ